MNPYGLQAPPVQLPPDALAALAIRRTLCRIALGTCQLPERVRIPDEIETEPAHLAADISAARYGMAYHTSQPMPLHPSAGEGERWANAFVGAAAFGLAAAGLWHLAARLGWVT